MSCESEFWQELSGEQEVVFRYRVICGSVPLGVPFSGVL
jgi:hypothetical protein